MHSAVSGQIPQRMRQFLIAIGVLVLAGAGQAASAPSPLPTISGVLAGLAALGLGAVMAFLRRAFCAAQGVEKLFSFDAFSSREPVTHFAENAILKFPAPARRRFRS